MVKTRDLVDLGHRQFHLLRECHQVCGREVTEFILDFVQMFDQQVSRARFIAEQTLYIEQRVEIDDPALGFTPAALLAIIDSVGFELRL